ncbi:MAG: twin-arginine translocation signal domain-containing protein, partial [Nitrosotalea sp.]
MTELKQDESGNIDRDALTRRDFLKLLAAGGVALTFTPFVPWGQFMPNPDNSVPGKQQVVLSDGSNANTNTFPVNHS